MESKQCFKPGTKHLSTLFQSTVFMYMAPVKFNIKKAKLK